MKALQLAAHWQQERVALLERQAVRHACSVHVDHHIVTIITKAGWSIRLDQQQMRVWTNGSQFEITSITSNGLMIQTESTAWTLRVHPHCLLFLLYNDQIHIQHLILPAAYENLCRWAGFPRAVRHDTLLIAALQSLPRLFVCGNALCIAFEDTLLSIRKHQGSALLTVRGLAELCEPVVAVMQDSEYHWRSSNWNWERECLIVLRRDFVSVSLGRWYKNWYLDFSLDQLACELKPIQ
jgi:hypothetical protein